MTSENMLLSSLCVFLLVNVCLSTDGWKPTNFVHCRTNTDCHDENLCCSLTYALGKRHQGRQLPPDGLVHYCLPWKNENATWCELKLQYSEHNQNYIGLCPCGPGLRCTPTDQLNPEHYPRDKFGKCSPVTV